MERRQENYRPGDKVRVTAYEYLDGDDLVVGEYYNATVIYFSYFRLRSADGDANVESTQIFLDEAKTVRAINHGPFDFNLDSFSDPSILKIGQIVYLLDSPHAYSVYEKMYYISFDGTTSKAFCAHSHMELIPMPVEKPIEIDEADNVCPICMESLTESTNAADGIVKAHDPIPVNAHNPIPNNSSPNHLFHKQCLDRWTNDKCPYCRYPMNIKPVTVVIRSHKGGKNKKSKKNKRRQRKTRKHKKQR